eukprot:6491896-Amphidinium_carterae.2
MAKVHGPEIPADLMTKFLYAETMSEKSESSVLAYLASRRDEPNRKRDAEKRRAYSNKVVLVPVGGGLVQQRTFQDRERERTEGPSGKVVLVPTRGANQSTCVECIALDLSEVATGAMAFYYMVHASTTIIMVVFTMAIMGLAACTVSSICTIQLDLKEAEDMYRCVCEVLKP